MISRYITLGELMKRFNARILLDLQAIATRSTASFEAYKKINDRLSVPSTFESTTLDEVQRRFFNESFKSILKQCNELDFGFAAMMMQRIVDATSDSAVLTIGELNALVADFDRRLTDQAQAALLYSIDPNHGHFATEVHLFGEQVAISFKSAIADIEEAGKCLAFERWTAAVFHLSRVAEIAVVTIGKRVGYQSPKEGFGEVLLFLDNGLKNIRDDYKNASPLFKGDVEFLSGVTVRMHAVNQAWRQRVSHMDRKYTEEEALRIWDATKGLMQDLATKLREETNG